MKKIKLELESLIVVLEAMRQAGTENIIFFEHEGHPAITDADNPDMVVAFAPDYADEAEGEIDEDDGVLELPKGLNEDDGSLH